MARARTLPRPILVVSNQWGCPTSAYKVRLCFVGGVARRAGATAKGLCLIEAARLLPYGAKSAPPPAGYGWPSAVLVLRLRRSLYLKGSQSNRLPARAQSLLAHTPEAGPLRESVALGASMGGQITAICFYRERAVEEAAGARKVVPL